MAGQEVTAVTDHLDAAVRFRVLAPAAVGHYRFVHDPVPETILDALPGGERARLHLAVAGALESHAGAAQPIPAAELAHHLAAALPHGDPARARGDAELIADAVLNRFVALLEAGDPAFRSAFDGFVLGVAELRVQVGEPFAVGALGGLVQDDIGAQVGLFSPCARPTRASTPPLRGGTPPPSWMSRSAAARSPGSSARCRLTRHRHVAVPGLSQLGGETREAERDELAAAAGLGGRTRRLGDAGEQARKTVTARIRDSLRRIEREHPGLAAHLYASVSTGTFCCYRPAAPVRWQL